MDKIFSDSTDDAFKASVSDKIEEAKRNGSAELKDETTHLSFAESNGDVVIEDKNNDNEVTVAKKEGDDYKLEGVKPEDSKSKTKMSSETLKDAVVTKPEGEGTESPIKEGKTQPDVKVDIKETPAITDEDKAGVGKNFSIEFSGFESQEDAQAFYSDLMDACYSEDEVISFSDDEKQSVVENLEEAEALAKKVEKTADAEKAAELKDKCESIKAYSLLASQMGEGMEDVYEVASYYSDFADEALTECYSDMDVNEYFSNLDEDEANEYFSNLDEVSANVLYSILEEGEQCTFSEADEIIDQCYSDMMEDEELSQPILATFSDDELNSFFSLLDEGEANMVYSALEEDENLSFSDVNEILGLANTPLNEYFSDFDDEDVATFSEEVGDEVADLAFSMATDEEENYTYSDFVNEVEYMNLYADAEAEKKAEEVEHNAKELSKAAADLKETQDPELAKKVKVLADVVKEDAEKAEAAGAPVSEDTKAKCQSYSSYAESILDANGIALEDIDTNAIFSNQDELENEMFSADFDSVDTNKDGLISKSEWVTAGNSGDQFEVIDTNKDGVISRDEFVAFQQSQAQAAPAQQAPAQQAAPQQAPVQAAPTPAQKQASYSYFSDEQVENRIFSNSASLKDASNSINPFLSSSIN